MGWLFAPWVTGGSWRCKAGVWNRNCFLGSYPSNHLEVSAQCKACVSNALYIYGKRPREEILETTERCQASQCMLLGSYSSSSFFFLFLPLICLNCYVPLYFSKRKLHSNNFNYLAPTEIKHCYNFLLFSEVE